MKEGEVMEAAFDTTPQTWFDEYLAQIAYDLRWGLIKIRRTPVLMSKGKRWRFRRGWFRRVDIYRRVSGKWAAFGAGYYEDEPSSHGLFFVSDEGVRGYYVTMTKKGQVIRLADEPTSERELLFWADGFKALRGEKPSLGDGYYSYSRIPA